MRRGTTPTLRLALEDIDPEEIRSLHDLVLCLSARG